MKKLSLSAFLLFQILSLNAQTNLYWTDSGSGAVRSVDTDGNNFTGYFPGFTQLWAMAIDTINEKVYWSDLVNDEILRTNYDGTAFHVVQTQVRNCRGMRIDPVGQKLYWTEKGLTNQPLIRRSNLDGSFPQTLVSTGINYPNGIALDVQGGKMYWTDQGTDDIKRANLNGTNVEVLVTGLNWVYGIDLDLVNGKMYWSETNSGKFSRANLDGTDVEVLLSSGNGTTPLEFRVYPEQGKIYSVNPYVYRMDLDATNIEQLSGTDFASPSSILIHPGQNLLFYAVGNGAWPYQIRRMTLDGYNEDIVLQNMHCPTGITIDFPNDRMYFTEFAFNTIYEASLDGSERYPLISGLYQPAGIAVDRLNARLYWTEKKGGLPGIICRSNMDGTDKTTIISGLNDPHAIALDPSGEKLYWTDSGDKKLQRANYDGTGIEDLITDELACVGGIATHPAINKIFLTDCAGGRILQANMDGTDRETIVDGLNEPLAIALDLIAGLIYWSENGSNTIKRGDFNGDNIGLVTSIGINIPESIALGICQASSVINEEICEGEAYQFGSFTYSQPGSYSVTYTDPEGCQNKTLLNLTVDPSPQVSLGSDVILFLEDTVAFEAGSGFEDVVWNNGDIGTEFVFVAEEYGVGTHPVIVTVFNEFGCSASDTVQVTVNMTTSSVSADARPLNWKVSPNPVSCGQPLNLTLNGVQLTDNDLQVVLYNSRLQPIARYDFKMPLANGSLNLPGVEVPGIYFLHMQMRGSLVSETRKVIVLE